MRILHLASWYPNRGHVQLGNFVQRHIEALPNHLESRVLHVWTGGRMGRENRLLGIDAEGSNLGCVQIQYVLDFPPRRKRIERGYMQFYRRLNREGYRPDIVHLHNAAEAARPACRMAKLWGVPLVVSENWTAYHVEHGRAFRKKEERGVRMALNRAAVHLPVSEHLARAMARYASDVQQVVIPNVVESVFGPPAEPRDLDGALRLLHVSSLIDDHKDITGMLHAMAVALKNGADVTLDCLGGAGSGGAEVGRYERLVLDLGLKDRVVFHGPASSAQVAEAMCNADAFVLFSQYENLPCVLLEAWMTGLPVVATDVGGVGEHMLRNPKLGTLLQVGDRKGLTEAIVCAAKDKAMGIRPDSGAIQAYASARFTQRAVGLAFEAVYRSVLD